MERIDQLYSHSQNVRTVGCVDSHNLDLLALNLRSAWKTVSSFEKLTAFQPAR